MADRPNILTRRLTRDKLASFLGNRQELIKAFEDLIEDLTQTLPDAIEGTSQDGSNIIAAEVFRQRLPLTPPARPNDAQQILASRIFGA